MKEASALIGALTGLAWPLFASVVVWRLFPVIKNIAGRGNFTVRMGDAELTVQQFSDKLVEATADIQQRLTAVSASEGQEEPSEQTERPPGVLRRVLWVDDQPANNAYETAQLQSLGVEVVHATSTGEGVRALHKARPPFDAVISDMGRSEPAGYNTDAGLDLIREIRSFDDTTPVFVYASTKTLARKEEIATAGGNGVAWSPVKLFDLLHDAGEFPGAADG
ncbi:response regulator [Streptomyces sp. NPDC093598]|uniref:response regulator n=1 Tax=Streptomyces sp. NPDC093598 TaxID=3366046 RepID=UPI0037F77A76